MQRYKCKCPNCGHEWTYIPRHLIPSRHPICPRCRKSIDFIKCCKLA